MDLLALIKSKTNYFRGTPSGQGLEAVVHHIEISENHFQLAKNGNEYLYTDVIYRTNQAFEGALKEAYRILKETDPSNKSPSDIEKYFGSNDVLKDRVLALFKNYRTEWRNKATHNYQLFFSSQEAFLAIVSVSAFLTILLDQMIVKQSFDLEKEKIGSREKDFFANQNIYQSFSFKQQVIELLKLFSEELEDESEKCTPLKRFELEGRVAGFISKLDPEIEVLTDYPIGTDNRKMRVDMLLRKGNSSLIIELKILRTASSGAISGGVNQLKQYLIASNLSQGIVFAPIFGSEAKVDCQEFIIDESSRKLNIVAFTPVILNK